MNRHLPKLAPARNLADLPRFAPIRRPPTATPRRSERRHWKASHKPKHHFDTDH